MELKIKIDLKQIEEFNNTKAEALFRYIKNVSKNKTPVILKGIKQDNHWDCNIYECAIPASHFKDIKLPSGSDRNPNGTEMYVYLTNRLLSIFTDGTEYIFKDTEVNAKVGTSKIREPYHYSKETLVDQLEQYLEILNSNSAVHTKLTVTNEELLPVVLKEISSNPTGTIFINKDSITVLNETVLFRTVNSCTFEGSDLYINMYTANKILSTLEYCPIVTLAIDERHCVITGYDENQGTIVRNISSIFDTDVENPSDEDLEAILPAENSTVVDLDLTDFLNTIGGQSSIFSTFIQKKNIEAALYKNGEGISFKLNKNDNGEITFLNINIGKVVEDEPSDEVFTEYETVVPLNTIKTLMKDNQILRIVFDSTPGSDSVVVFESGNYKILSGQI